jgi:MerR family transcriptional regulator/heat shock protein HspR
MAFLLRDLCRSTAFIERSRTVMKQEAYSIGDVAEELAVHPQTLRNWERAGLITPTRVAGNRRVYFSEDLEKLRYIVRLEREDGLRVAGIRKVLQIEGKL